MTDLHKTKKKRSTENLLSRNIIFATATGESVKKRQLADYLGEQRRQICGGTRTRANSLKDENSSCKLTVKKTRSNKINDEVKRKVY